MEKVRPRAMPLGKVLASLWGLFLITIICSLCVVAHSYSHQSNMYSSAGISPPRYNRYNVNSYQSIVNIPVGGGSMGQNHTNPLHPRFQHHNNSLNMALPINNDQSNWPQELHHDIDKMENDIDTNNHNNKHHHQTNHHAHHNNDNQQDNHNDDLNSPTNPKAFKRLPHNVEHFFVILSCCYYWYTCWYCPDCGQRRGNNNNNNKHSHSSDNTPLLHNQFRCLECSDTLTTSSRDKISGDGFGPEIDNGWRAMCNDDQFALQSLLLRPSNIPLRSNHYNYIDNVEIGHSEADLA